MNRLTILLVGLIFFSCSSEKENIESHATPEILSFKITYPDLPTGFFDEIKGDLIDGKINTLTRDYSIRGVHQPKVVTRQNFYTATGKIHKIVTPGYYTEFFYDKLDRLVGLNNIISEPQSIEIYERFRYTDKINEVICERIDKPYDDPNAQVSNRMFLYFLDENITSYAFDINRDEKPDRILKINYSGDNVVSFQKIDGSFETIEYQNFIDTYGYLLNKSTGKKTSQLIYFEGLTQNTPAKYFKNVSNNVMSDELKHCSYEVNAYGFYTKRTFTRSNASREVIEFTFR